MGLKFEIGPSYGVLCREMKDGDVARVLEWYLDTCISQIVLRHGNDLIFLGETKESTIENFFSDIENEHHAFYKVKILGKGDSLIFT